jgi:uncharacterized membrane protein YgaE (UPF0421/DUF939 family)
MLAWSVTARRRVRASFWPVSQAALAATLAWLIAHKVLGHPQPFFAPIAAAISLSTSYIRRSFRIVQMVIGVLLGIAVGELLSSLLGTSTAALGVLVFMTMLLAVLVGGGFVGQGMMFANQAAASAILVVALRRPGIGAERAIDAVIGGATAFLIGVVLFPSGPLPRLRDAERGVLRSLADALGHLASLLRSAQAPEPDWVLQTGYAIHEQLALLADARATARANVRIAPRRWHLRAVVEAEDGRIARLDLLANAVLSLVRAATAPLDDRPPLPAPLREQIAELATAIERLSSTAQPWPPALLEDVAGVARRSVERAGATRVDRAAVVASILRATAQDLDDVIRIDT